MHVHVLILIPMVSNLWTLALKYTWRLLILLFSLQCPGFLKDVLFKCWTELELHKAGPLRLQPLSPGCGGILMPHRQQQQRNVEDYLEHGAYGLHNFSLWANSECTWVFRASGQLSSAFITNALKSWVWFLGKALIKRGEISRIVLQRRLFGTDRWFMEARLQGNVKSKFGPNSLS